MSASRSAPPAAAGGNNVAMVERVFEGLRDEIVSGKLPPGTPLSRRQIAGQFGTSYSPVIEAMVRLENAGLIEARPAQMARVREVTLEAIYDDHTLREAYETQAIRLACQHRTEAEIEELYGLAEAVEDRLTAADQQSGPRLDWQFHERIAQVSRSGVLQREMARLGLLTRLRHAWMMVPLPLDRPQHHVRLVDHIRDRDVQAADALMREHVHSGLEQELRAFRLGLSSTPGAL